MTGRTASEPQGRFLLLLVSLVLLAVVYPVAERLEPDLRLDLVLRLAVWISALRALSDYQRTRWMLGLLGVGSLAASAMSTEPAGPWALAGLATALVFYTTVLGLLVRSVFHRSGVTRDSLYGAACTYLLIALTFGTAYHGLELLAPGSLHLPELMSIDRMERTFAYFSAVTLTTLGYGDVVPVSDAARSLVVVEAVIGVLYPSILIARVVALYASGDTSAPFERPTRLGQIWRNSSRFEALFALQALHVVAYPYLPLGWTRLVGAAIVLTAVFILPTNRRRRALGIAFGAPALLHWSGWAPGLGWSLAGAAFLTTFLFLATFWVLEHVARQREVDREVIFGACCAYLLLGAAFSAAYQFVFAAAPGEFSLPAGMSPSELFAAMTYLSYVTLTTLGYGDILPLDGAAHTLASLEAIVGILFPAILVARLVSLYRLRAS